MGNIKKGKKNKKKCLSNAKLKNIRQNKLGKQGVLKKDRMRERRKENRKEKARAVVEREKEMKRNAEIEKEREISGEDLMDMMDQDDLDTLLKAHGRKRTPIIDDVESEGRQFKEYNLKTKDGKDVKESLPVLTEDGWKEKLVVHSSTPGLTLTQYKRNDLKKSKGNDIKKAKGNHIKKDPSHEEDEDYADLLESETTFGKTTPGEVKSVVQILAERKRHLHEQKVKMACLALNVVQDSTKLINIKFLLNMLTINDPRSDATIYKYTLQTILQVFHDLIPGYRIQEDSLKNTMAKVKLLTARQELEFIDYYKKFLKALEKILSALKEEPNNLGLTAVSETAIYCLGDLVVRHPAFNFSVNIVQALVPYLNHRHEKIRKLAFDSLSHVIKNDQLGYLPLEIVRRIYRFTHRLNFKVKEEVLRVLLSLRGSEMKNSDKIRESQKAHSSAISHKEKLIIKLTEKFRQKPSRSQKRERRKMAKLSKQMENINVAEMENLENFRHTEIVQKVFGLYIHVVKNKPNSKLLPVVLEGLAKFAHLVNMEFFSDLLEVMNKFLEEGSLKKKESLHCIQTVFTILSGQGEVLNIDPHRFYNQFYLILIELNTRQTEENIEAILDILEQMLALRRRQVSSAKVLSFMKRIATMSLQFPHHLAIPTLLKLKKLFSLFPVSEVLLDSDQEGFPGVFSPEVPDPEHANSGASAIWELILAQRSYQPYVALLSTNILFGAPVRDVPALHSIIEKPTLKLVEDFGHTNLKFNPETPEPSAHLKSLKKKAPKRLFQNGELDLEDLKLQEICDNVLSQVNSEEEDTKEPPRKRLKNIEDEDLDFFANFQVNGDDSKNDDTASSRKDFTSALVDIK